MRPYALEAVEFNDRSFVTLAEAVQETLLDVEQGRATALGVCSVAEIDFQQSFKQFSADNHSYAEVASKVARDGIDLCRNVSSVLSEDCPTNKTLQHLLSDVTKEKESCHKSWYDLIAMFAEEKPRVIEEKGSGDAN